MVNISLIARPPFACSSDSIRLPGGSAVGHLTAFGLHEREGREQNAVICIVVTNTAAVGWNHAAAQDKVACQTQSRHPPTSALKCYSDVLPPMAAVVVNVGVLCLALGKLCKAPLPTTLGALPVLHTHIYYVYNINPPPPLTPSHPAQCLWADADPICPTRVHHTALLCTSSKTKKIPPLQGLLFSSIQYSAFSPTNSSTL